MSASPLPNATTRAPRLGGLLLRLARANSAAPHPCAGKRWNPIFSVVRHVGRRSGRTYEAPVAARRVDDGFVVALAFGRSAHWYCNLVARAGGVVVWQGREYPVGNPREVDAADALATFLPIQRAGLRAAGVDGYVHLPDADR